MEERLLLVTGSPRGGTRYLTALLQAIHIHVRHEAMGFDGCVSGFMAADVPLRTRKHSGVRSDFAFRHVWHLVRHPLAWIRSAHAHLGPGQWKAAVDHTGIEVPLDRSGYPRQAWPELGLHWVIWHLLCEREAELTINLEAVEKAWPRMMEILRDDPACYAVEAGTNKRPKPLPPLPKIDGIGHEPEKLHLIPEVTWEMLGPMESTVRAVARRWGYKE